MANRFDRLVISIVAAVALAVAGDLAAQTIPLPVSMNGVSAGEKPVNIEGDDITMRRADLEQFGVGGMMWQRLVTFGRLRRAPQPIDGADAVSLKSLAPFLTFAFDEANLTLGLTVRPELLKPNVVDTRAARPADLVYSRDKTGFVNYAVTSPSLRNFTFFGEAGASVGKGLLYSGFSRAVNGHLVRGMTNYTYDDTVRLRRWTAGDTVVATTSLGGSAIMTGVTVARNFGLDPYFLRFPSLDLAGTAATPSQVDVYVNGVLVGRHEVAPGPFQLRDVPIAAGSGTTQIVVRDAFGRQTTASTNYYFATNLLTPGLSEYLYSAGAIREDFGVRSFSTGDPAAVAFHRIGVSDKFTVGGRAEASRELVSGGPIVDFQSPVGEWRLAGAVSTDHGRTGSAGEIGYRFISRRFGFGGTVRKMSNAYSTISMPSEVDRALLDATLFGSVSNRFGSITAQWSKFDLRDNSDVTRTTLGASMPLGRRAALIASASAVTDAGVRRNEYFAGASFNFGFSTTATLSVGSTGDGHYETIAELQRPLPIGEGYGYRLQTQVGRDGDHVDLGALQYQTSFGRYEISEQSGVDHRPTISAAGGIVYADRSLHFALPVQESYALVQVPGVDDVRVYASNQLVGRTNRHGSLLVPNLLAYYGNPLHIEDKDIPMTYEVAQVEKTVAPPYRGGAVVRFPVRQHRSVTGSLTVSKGSQHVRPSLGTLTVAGGGGKWESPVGRAGEFYLEDIGAGTYDALIEWTDGRCAFQLTLPAGKGEIVNIGDIACTQH